MPDRSSKTSGEPQPPAQPQREKDPLAVELGRRGGLKGGRARAESLSGEHRSAIARKAAIARWERRDQPPVTDAEGFGVEPRSSIDRK